MRTRCRGVSVSVTVIAYPNTVNSLEVASRRFRRDVRNRSDKNVGFRVSSLPRIIDRLD